MTDNKLSQETIDMIRQCKRVFVVAAVSLALFQSDSLLIWTLDMTPSAVSENLVMLAERWHDLMGSLGASGITDAIREKVLFITGG